MSTPTNLKFATPRAALLALSQRTGTALPSLLTSFAVLHELTALVPLLGFFYTARTLGVGEGLLSSLDLDNINNPSASADSNSKTPDSNWLKSQASKWITEGEERAHRIGRRYNISGLQEDRVAGRLTGDIANAVVAYGATKVRLSSSFLFFVGC